MEDELHTLASRGQDHNFFSEILRTWCNNSRGVAKALRAKTMHDFSDELEKRITRACRGADLEIVRFLDRIELLYAPRVEVVRFSDRMKLLYAPRAVARSLETIFQLVSGGFH